MRSSAPLRAAPVALLLLLPLLFFARTLFGGEALLAVHTDQLSPWRAEVGLERAAELSAASGPLSLDKTICFHPLLIACMQRMQAGQAPLWDPDNLCGVPLLAQAVHGALSPPLLLMTALLPLAVADGWIALMQTVLAALGMYLLAREFRCGRWPAALAGLAFAFSGFFSTRFQFLQVTGAAIWLPFVLLGVERIVAGARWRAVAGTALALGCSFLAGFPQSTLHILYAASIWAAVRLAGRWRQGGPERAALLPATWHLGAALLLGVVIGWPQFGTSAEMALSPDSTRRTVAPEVVATLGMTPATLAAALAPDLFGNPRDLAAHDVPQLREAGVLSRLFCKPGSNAVETASTFGVLPLLLALLGLAVRRPGRALGALLLCGGALLAIDTPLLAPLMHLPTFNTGDPRRFLLWFEAGGALLAALGLAQLLEHGPPRWYTSSVCALTLLMIVLTGVVLSLGVPEWTSLVVPALAAKTGIPQAEIAAQASDLALDLTLLQKSALRLTCWLVLGSGALLIAARRPSLGAAVLLAGAAIDLLAFAHSSTSVLPAARYFAPPPDLAALLDDDGGRLVRFFPGPRANVRDYPLPPSTALAFGVRDVSGYVALSPRRVEALSELVQAGTATNVGTAALSDPDALDSPLLDVMAVTRVLSSVPLDRPGLTLLQPVGDAWLYRNEGALPRAWLARELLVVADEAAARAALADAGTDPRSRVVVEAPFDGRVTRGSPSDGSAPGVAPAGATGSARFVRDEPELVELAVSSPGDCVLVLSDSWMPGWSAEVDGEPAPMRPANLAFRAVAVPPGEHRVVFRYSSPSWNYGAPAASAALLFVIGCLLFARRTTRPPQGVVPRSAFDAEKP